VTIAITLALGAVIGVLLGLLGGGGSILADAVGAQGTGTTWRCRPTDWPRR
jgi:uncharacterized protein